jgi:hypothetical protein
VLSVLSTNFGKKFYSGFFVYSLLKPQNHIKTVAFAFGHQKDNDFLFAIGIIQRKTEAENNPKSKLKRTPKTKTLRKFEKNIRSVIAINKTMLILL